MLGVFPEWQGLPLIPTRAAANELYNEGLNMLDVLQVLEEGEDFGEMRAQGIEERFLRRGDRSLKVVVAHDYNRALQTECWTVIHVKSVRA